MSKWKSSSYDPPFPDSQHSNKRATEAEVRRLFDALDKDHNGYIDRHELQETMKEVGLNLTEKDINTMMQVANVPIKDRIFYEDFVKMMAGRIGHSQRRALFKKRDAQGPSTYSICEGEEEDPDLQAMRVAFSMFDKDGDGLISLQEVHDTMASLGIRVSAKDVKQIVKRVDLDGDGSINFEEFCQAMNKHHQIAGSKSRSRMERGGDSGGAWVGSAGVVGPLKKQELADAFQVFDKDKDGFLSADDLRCTMQQLGLTLTEEDLKAMMTSAKIGPSGRISFADFCSIYRSQSSQHLESTSGQGQMRQSDGKKSFTNKLTKQQETAEIRAVFSIFDMDKDGYITMDEVVEVLLSMGSRPSHECIEEVFEQVDLDGNGKIDFDEFLLLVRRYEKPLPEEVEAREMFKAMDKDGNGFIDTLELKTSFGALGVPLTDDDVKIMMEEANIKSNKIFFKDFLRIMSGKFGASVSQNTSFDSDCSFNYDFNSQARELAKSKTLTRQHAYVDRLMDNLEENELDDDDADDNDDKRRKEDDSGKCVRRSSRNSVHQRKVKEPIEKEEFVIRSNLESSNKNSGSFKKPNRDDDNNNPNNDNNNNDNKNKTRITTSKTENIITTTAKKNASPTSKQKKPSSSSSSSELHRHHLLQAKSLSSPQSFGTANVMNVAPLSTSTAVKSSSQQQTQANNKQPLGSKPLLQCHLPNTTSLEVQEFFRESISSEYTPASLSHVFHPFSTLTTTTTTATASTSSRSSQPQTAAATTFATKSTSSTFAKTPPTSSTKTSSSAIFPADQSKSGSRPRQQSTNIPPLTKTTTRNKEVSPTATTTTTSPVVDINFSTFSTTTTSTKRSESKQPSEQQMFQPYQPQQQQKQQQQQQQQQIKQQQQPKQQQQSHAQPQYKSSLVKGPPPDTWIAFKIFDRNADGYISKTELQRTMFDLGINLSSTDLDDMMKQADINKDGKIDYAEFTKLMMGSFEVYAKQVAQLSKTRRASSTGRAAFQTIDSSSPCSQLPTQTLLNPNYHQPQQPQHHNRQRYHHSSSPSSYHSNGAAITLSKTSTSSYNETSQQQFSNKWNHTYSNSSSSSKDRHKAAQPSSDGSRSSLPHHDFQQQLTAQQKLQQCDNVVLISKAQSFTTPQQNTQTIASLQTSKSAQNQKFQQQPNNATLSSQQNRQQPYQQSAQQTQKHVQQVQTWQQETQQQPQLQQQPQQPHQRQAQQQHPQQPFRQTSLIRTQSVEDEMRSAFKIFDIDGNGLIDAQELKQTMQNLEEVLTDKDVEAMILAVDKNGDGKVDYEEFIQLLRFTQMIDSTTS